MLFISFEQFYAWGYTATVILLTLLFFVLRKKRERVLEWLSISNLLMLVYFILSFYYLIIHYFGVPDTFLFRGAYIRWAYYLTGLNGPILPPIITILVIVLFVLFLFKRFRKSILLSYIAIAALYPYLIFELADRFYRDYIPSTWSTYYEYDYLYYLFIFLAFVLFNALVFSFYLLKPFLTKK